MGNEIIIASLSWLICGGVSSYFYFQGIYKTKGKIMLADLLQLPFLFIFAPVVFLGNVAGFVTKLFSKSGKDN